MQSRYRRDGTPNRWLRRLATAPAVGFVLCLFVVLGTSACRSDGAFGRSSQSSEELLSRADRSFEVGSFGEAVEMYKLASVAARTEKDDARFVEAVAQVSSAYSMLGQPSEGESWLAQARTAASLPRPHTNSPRTDPS